MCGIEPFFFSKQAYIWRSFLESVKKLIVQELPYSTPALLCPPSSVCFLPLCLQSNGSWSRICLEGRLVLAWIGGDCSDLHACKRVSPKGDDPSLHRQTTYTTTLTGSKQDLLLNGNVSQERCRGGWRRQPQGAGWDPGSGTQNGSGASDHLLPGTQMHMTLFSPQHEQDKQDNKSESEDRRQLKGKSHHVLPSRSLLGLLARALLPPRTPPRSRPWTSQTPGQPVDPQLTSKWRSSGSGWRRAALPLSSAGGRSSTGHGQRWLLAAQTDITGAC